jgi:TetR/AcrR family transcriptional regulator
MKVQTYPKQDQIVGAALKRFSDYGITSTSLTEVAEDLSLSKQTLFYYFQDKHSLVQAVLEKLSTDYVNQIRVELDRSQSVEDGLLKLTELKAVFFENYYLLAAQAGHPNFARPGSIHDWEKTFTEKEAVLITDLFEKGIQTGELKNHTARQTADLLLETLYAFTTFIRESVAIPHLAAFRNMLTRQQQVIRIFYQVLKVDTTVN